jgi:hypothetical protein
MVPARGFALLPIGALVLLAGAALAQALPQGDRILMRFEVFGFADLHVVTNQTEIDEVGEHYKIVSDLATRGVTGIVVALAEHNEVRGRLTPDSALPEAFRSDIRRNGVDRHDRVDYRGDGSVDGAASPPPVTLVAPAQMRGTVDDLTAYFQLERHLARGGDCTLVVAVYDGRLRYDLHYTDRGEQILSRAGGQRFAGAARACHMKRVEIAGFPTDPKVSEGAQEGTIWYARLMPGDLFLPVRMELETEIGSVTAYLAELHGRGVDLKLME